MTGLLGPSTLVVGASRGLGRGIAIALAKAGTPVVAVARTGPALAELAASGDIRTEVADAADAATPGWLLDRYEPRAVVLVAGARPLPRPLHRHTWETFSVNWETDVKMAFGWLRESLLKPLAPGSRVVMISSGAALAGSPLSGGYAGAKATQRLMTGYAQDESNRADLGITFTAVLPKITPLTGQDRRAAEACQASAARRSWPTRRAAARPRRSTSGSRASRSRPMSRAPLSSSCCRRTLAQSQPRTC
jgi:NAD(P)-dependent dehydrogenase (short-subunit alcohol dehydrogenase family)